ncbi:MAG TPA: hypothetical protein VFQ91_23980 [Bryobacteraceae bacterium]|nr:hypothetical protein [Bryobacteraceae bacterium]
MRLLLTLCFVGCGTVALGQELAARARQLEEKGQAGAARTLILSAAREAPNDPVTLTIAAEFLDRHGDPAARGTYEKLIAVLSRNGSRERSRYAKRLAALDMLAGEPEAAEKHLAQSGAGAFPTQKKALDAEYKYIEIPGPIRSFSRMAALSPELPGEEILPALARNVVTNGYQAANSNEGLEPTEYLKLVVRYLSQARELNKLAGDTKKIRVEQCESAVTGDLLRALGYRMRGGCGADVVLETVNASRAFLTIDSGFPLAALEQSLRANRPFEYDYQPTRVPVLYGAEYWLGTKDKPAAGEFIDLYIGDPQLCRLYLGMSKLDREVAAKLKASVAVTRLKAFSHVLDFFGGMYTVRDGKAVVPGGAKAEGIWGELAGSPVSDPAAFFDKLNSKDDGWLASYYDSLMRVSGPAQDYLTQADRLRRFYGAVKGRVTSPGPARPVFRANTDLLLLTTRLRFDTDGKPHIPGTVEVWKQLFIKHPHGKYDGKLTKAAAGWKDADDILEALFALCRKAVENEPLKVFMALSDMNRKRPQPMSPATIDRLAREYRFSGSQYSLLNETGALQESTILAYLDTMPAVGGIRDLGARANAVGTMQGLLSIWQILVRQGSIAEKEADGVMAAILTSFAKVKNDRDTFDAGWAGVQTLLKATHTPEGANPQDRFVDLLAGTANAEDVETHTQLVQDLIRVVEAQRLVSLKALGDLSAHLDALGKGGKLDPGMVQRVSGRLSEIQLPRAGLTGVEKNAMIFGYWSERHIEMQRKLNLRAQVEKAAGDANKLADVRGALTPLLRDTLVGLNYAHYAPPGAQILYTNPVFVRSHDFLGLQGAAQTWRQTEVVGSGWPASSGGRLVGSLCGLPYALAEAEQNFLIPSREQALIWGDLVPQIVQSSKIQRFWNVTPTQMQWVALHMRLSEVMLAEAALDDALRGRVTRTLAQYAPPARARQVGEWLAEGRVKKALDNVTPSELFLLAREMHGLRAEEGDQLAAEIRQIAKAAPEAASYAAISRAFGTSKPTLTNSYSPELLNIRTFPTLMGYSSRIMAESWESSLLYFASVADSSYMMPSQLNVAVPEWTRHTVEKIFATHLEDWPALLRSMRQVGDEVRNKAQKAVQAQGGGE